MGVVVFDRLNERIELCFEEHEENFDNQRPIIVENTVFRFKLKENKQKLAK